MHLFKAQMRLQPPAQFEAEADLTAPVVAAVVLIVAAEASEVGEESPILQQMALELLFQPPRSQLQNLVPGILLQQPMVL